jgi:formyltetrahydrofolate-dependent phosphoribosylglycinamide formyltransferase
MQAILEAIKQRTLDAEVAVVLSNNADAAALKTAAEYGVTASAVPNRGLTREAHEDAVLAELAKYKFDYLVLAGYMRVLTPRFLQTFKHQEGYFRVINIHPSLLPAFPGAHGYEDAYNYGVRISGITVHLVDEHVDHGPILAQESFVRREDDTLDSFKARGLAVEHKLYPAVLQQIAERGLRLLGASKDALAATQIAGSKQ